MTSEQPGGSSLDDMGNDCSKVIGYFRGDAAGFCKSTTTT